jgi:hypothetical protein
MKGGTRPTCSQFRNGSTGEVRRVPSLETYAPHSERPDRTDATDAARDELLVVYSLRTEADADRRSLFDVRTSNCWRVEPECSAATKTGLPDAAKRLPWSRPAADNRGTVSAVLMSARAAVCVGRRARGMLCRAPGFARVERSHVENGAVNGDSTRRTRQTAQTFEDNIGGLAVRLARETPCRGGPESARNPPFSTLSEDFCPIARSAVPTFVCLVISLPTLLSLCWSAARLVIHPSDQAETIAI